MILKRGKKNLKHKDIIYCGLDNDSNSILLPARTRGLLDENIMKAESQIYKENKMPVTMKSVDDMDQFQRELYNVTQKNETTKFVMIYDETDPEIKKIKNNTMLLRTYLYLVSFLDMESYNEYEDGTKIDGWDYFNETFGAKITKGSYYELTQFLISEKGFTDVNWSYMKEDIDRLKSGTPTVGRYQYDGLESLTNLENEHKEALNSAQEEINASEG